MLVQLVRPFTMSHLDVTVSSNLEACNWDIMICIYIMNHHESWCHRCILPTPFHQKNLKHNFILWCKISSRFYLYEVQFWDHCCHRYCIKFVPHRSNGDTLAFQSLGQRGCFWPRFVRDAYKRVGMKVGSSWGSTPVCEAIHGKFHHFPRDPC